MAKEAAACDLLYGHWAAGTVTADLPEALRPQGRAAAYRVQQSILRHSAAPQAGWKIAATSKAGQAHINVDGPMAGTLLAERRVEAGGENAARREPDAGGGAGVCFSHGPNACTASGWLLDG